MQTEISPINELKKMIIDLLWNEAVDGELQLKNLEEFEKEVSA